MRRSILVLIVVCAAGCATLARDYLNTRYGAEDTTRFDQAPAVSAGGVSYRNDIQPLLEKRCVVCHACYDAPCQLKLGSWQGIARGASKALVYDATRLDEAAPTRLFVDAQRASQWRQQGFSAVLNERTPTPENNLAASVLFRSLALKQAHPLPQTKVLSNDFDFSLDRSQTCPRLDEYDAYERDHPLGGMPYGLPALTEAETAMLTRWLAAGSPDDTRQALPPQIVRQIGEWERFLNGSSFKQRLMSRYLYEHLFLGHLVFADDGERRSFRIVRSLTPPGTPTQVVATRRPYDDPGVPRVYYRLEREGESIVAKTHMPYLLSPERMSKYRRWFLDADYAVSALPAYSEEQGANPFVTFAAIPPDARYRFLLDEAEFFVMNFIKGPVCRGQLALNVIDSHFWVFFVSPDSGVDAAAAELLARQADNLKLPAAYGSDAPVISAWRDLAQREKQLLAAKSELLKQHFGGARQLELSDVWDGDASNPNAALTIFRHFNSASVVKGLVGEAPKTAWVIGYPLFERIYYLLVAGYDPYGNIGHQLLSRLYMDFLRMEGETSFLALLPKVSRPAIRDYWYRGASAEVKSYVDGARNPLDVETGIRYRSADPQRELYGMLGKRLAPVLGRRFDLSGVADAALRSQLSKLAAVRGESLSWLPPSVVLRVDDPPRAPQYFTLLSVIGHSNVSHLLLENSELLPAENTLVVVPGFIGAYPNALYRVTPRELPELRAAIAGLSSEADYSALADRFAIRRTSPDFWAASDALMAAYVEWSPLEAGLFDYSRLENR